MHLLAPCCVPQACLASLRGGLQRLVLPLCWLPGWQADLRLSWDEGGSAFSESGDPLLHQASHAGPGPGPESLLSAASVATQCGLSGVLDITPSLAQQWWPFPSLSCPPRPTAYVISVLCPLVMWLSLPERPRLHSQAPIPPSSQSSLTFWSLSFLICKMGMITCVPGWQRAIPQCVKVLGSARRTQLLRTLTAESSAAYRQALHVHFPSGLTLKCMKEA